MSALLEHALGYARRGRPVFPVDLRKRPLTLNGFKDASTDEATVGRWWTAHPDAGIGTPTGPGWFVLDDDTNRLALAALEAAYGQLPPTVEAITPRPGLHLYLRGEVTNSASGLPDGLDVRGSGGYVVLPPSPHTNGRYEWRTAPDESPIARAPAWLLELLRSRADCAPRIDGPIASGQRNTTLTSMAGTMRRRGFSEAAIVAALLIENHGRCKPPLDEREVRRIAHSIARYPPTSDPRRPTLQLDRKWWAS